LAQLYHRIESPTQTSEDAIQQESSQEIWGKPARGSEMPKVKAYCGPLPTQQRGIEFTTDIDPDPGMPPGFAFWSGPREGVAVKEGFAILRVNALVNRQS
jgi:hypothetical protein